MADDTLRSGQTVNMTDEPPKPAGPAPVAKAVAVEYERGVDNAPRITASGKGYLAEQILSLAFANGVKVREDADLVELLSVVDVDAPIPLEAFAAVAEILSYVYKANDAMKQRKASQP